VWVLFGLAIFAGLMFVFLRPVPKSDGYVKESVKDKTLAVFTALKHKGLLVMILYLHGIYASFAFPFSGFSVNVPFSLVPWVFTAYGGACMIGSFTIGALIDRLSTRTVLAIHLAEGLVLYALVFISIVFKIEPLYYVCGCLFGLFDSISLTLSSAMIMKFLPSEIFAGGMSVNRIIWGWAGVLVFLIQIFAPWYVTAGLTISLFVSGAVVLMIFMPSPIREVDLESPSASESAVEPNSLLDSELDKTTASVASKETPNSVPVSLSEVAPSESFQMTQVEFNSASTSSDDSSCDERSQENDIN